MGFSREAHQLAAGRGVSKRLFLAPVWPVPLRHLLRRDRVAHTAQLLGLGRGAGAGNHHLAKAREALRRADGDQRR